MAGTDSTDPSLYSLVGEQEVKKQFYHDTNGDCEEEQALCLAVGAGRL